MAIGITPCRQILDRCTLRIAAGACQSHHSPSRAFIHPADARELHQAEQTWCLDSLGSMFKSKTGAKRTTAAGSAGWTAGPFAEPPVSSAARDFRRAADVLAGHDLMPAAGSGRLAIPGEFTYAGCCGRTSTRLAAWRRRAGHWTFGQQHFGSRNRQSRATTWRWRQERIDNDQVSGRTLQRCPRRGGSRRVQHLAINKLSQSRRHELLADLA